MKNRFLASQCGAYLIWVAFGLGLPGDFVLSKVNALDFDVRQAGARCDGSDDAAVVQAALDTLPDGARLIVPCRAYIGPSGIRLLRKNDVTVEGVDGGGFVAAAGNPERILFAIEYCDRCVFRNLYIDSQKFALAGVSINFSTDSRVEGNLVVNPAYPAQAAIVGRVTAATSTTRTSSGPPVSRLSTTRSPTASGASGWAIPPAKHGSSGTP